MGGATQISLVIGYSINLHFKRTSNDMLFIGKYNTETQLTSFRSSVNITLKI